MRRIPWWVNPWRRVCQLRAINRTQAVLLDQQRDLVSMLKSELRGLRRLHAQRAAPTAFRPEIGTLDKPPEFVLVGIDRGGQGKRIYASREMGKTTFGMTQIGDPPPRWKIDSIMAKMLIIDKPSYGEALDHMAGIWRNWDAEKRGKTRGIEQRGRMGGKTAQSEETRKELEAAGWKAVGESEGKIQLFEAPTEERPWSRPDADVKGDIQRAIEQ